MTTKDVTRFLDQPPKHYSAVRIQQGRVLLDSDLNESARLEEDDRRRTFGALVGASASPDVGFSLGRPLPVGTRLAQTEQLREGQALPVRVVRLNGVPTNVHAVSLRAGSIYLGGMRFELGEPEQISFQRGFLQMTSADFPALELSPSPSPFSPSSPESPQYPEFHNFYYLNAWEQVVTAVEDEEFLESALAGPDTSVRVRRMRRVELIGVPPFIDNCAEAWETVIRGLESTNATLDRATNELKSNGRLGLVFESIPEGECPPCTPDRKAEYLGSENQALRIMLTSPSTFVWAFDNAAPLFRVRVTGLGDEDAEEIRVELLNPPRDEDHQPRRHRVVEIIPFGALIEDGERERRHDPHFLKVAAEVGVFTRVAQYDEDDQTFTLDADAGLDALRGLVHEWDRNHPAAAQLNVRERGSDARFFYARLWHQADRLTDIELKTTNNPNGAPLGDTGIVPVFHQPGRRGDFWLATLRVDRPERILPFDLLTKPGGVPPHGPRHFYAPLSLLDGDNTTVTRVEDCRPRMRQVTDRGCTTFTVGDGLLSVGDFTSIQEAVDTLPSEGGKISLLPGIFRQAVVIHGRRGIIIEGCGVTTIIETTGDDEPIVIVDGGSQDITLSNLTLHVGEQLGISVEDSNSVNLNGLTLFAGTLVASEFVAEPAAGDELVLIRDSGLVTVRDLVVEAQRRPAVHVDGSTDVTLRGLRCRQISQSTFAPPVDALFHVEATNGLRVRDSSFESCGVTTILLDNGVTNAELSILSVSAAPYTRDSDGETVFQTPMAIDFDGVSKVRLERSRVIQLSGPAVEHWDHAAVVIFGDDIMIEQNHIECQNSVTWGGVQIRGESRDVELRRNRITEGLGHGITLGSVGWRPGAEEALQRLGVGRSQVFMGDGERFITYRFDQLEGGPEDGWTAESEGPLTDIRLVDNRIERMGSNGISVLIVLLQGNSSYFSADEWVLIEVRNASIYGNTIIGNLLQPGTSSFVEGDSINNFPTLAEFLRNPPGSQDPVLPELPLGGIVLGGVGAGVEIRENTIVNHVANDSEVPQPFCGIFVFTGDNIVISGNRISENSSRIIADSDIIRGIRSGIAVLIAGTAPTAVSASLELLHNLENLLSSGGTGLDGAGVGLRVTNNSVQQTEGRALYVTSVGPVMVDGNFFSSGGNHEVGNTHQAGDVVFVVCRGGLWEAVGADAAALNATYAMPVQTVEFLFDVDDDGDELLQGPIGTGGQLLFNNNQVTYDWDFNRLPNSPGDNPISRAPVALLAVDHVSVCSNQFAMRLHFSIGLDGTSPPLETSDEPVATHVFVAGGTVCVMRNRCSEEVGSVFGSLYTVGRMLNMTAFNQTTHIVVAETWHEEGFPYLQDIGNQVMFVRSNSSPSQDAVAMYDAINDRAFFEFVWKDSRDDN